MPRRPRFDEPGLLHHVMSRGIARRTVFETRRDVRTFLALLAREVRDERIELLAFSVMTTHFHLLLRSRTGELDKVMQRVLNTYVRYFNRTRRRDGPLFRGRYRAKAVRGRHYLRVLIRYIDRNATHARLASTAPLYPYCSASHYIAAKRPRWLANALVDRLMGSPSRDTRYEAYARTFGGELDPSIEELIERRLGHPATNDDEWDSLIDAAPPRVLAWMIKKARLADGTKPGLPYVPAAFVRRVVDEEQVERGMWSCRAGKVKRRDAWPIVRVGLLRDLSGMTYAEICRAEGCSANMAARRVQQHAGLLEVDSDYRERAARLGSRCLAGDRW